MSVNSFKSGNIVKLFVPIRLKFFRLFPHIANYQLYWNMTVTVLLNVPFAGAFNARSATR